MIDTLYRGLADNTIGKIVDACSATTWSSSTSSASAHSTITAARLLFRFAAAAHERRSLGIGPHWPFESWGTSSWPLDE